MTTASSLGLLWWCWFIISRSIQPWSGWMSLTLWINGFDLIVVSNTPILKRWSTTCFRAGKFNKDNLTINWFTKLSTSFYQLYRLVVGSDYLYFHWLIQNKPKSQHIIPLLKRIVWPCLSRYTLVLWVSCAISHLCSASNTICKFA